MDTSLKMKRRSWDLPEILPAVSDNENRHTVGWV